MPTSTSKPLAEKIAELERAIRAALARGRTLDLK